MIVRPNSLQEILVKAELFGFGGEHHNLLAFEYDKTILEYTKQHPLPSINDFDATCAWIDARYETAYKATIKKLYEMVDGEQKK